MFLEYIVLIATSFLLEILYVGLSFFVCSRTKECALPGAARGGEGGVLRSCKSHVFQDLGSSSWRYEGSELSKWSGSDPAQSSFSEAEMDMASYPSSWPKDMNSSMLEGGGREVRAMSEVGLVQHRLGVGQAQAGDAVKVMIQWFDWSRADLANCSHYEFNRWSRRFWCNCRGHRIYTVSSSSYLHALRQLASHLDWRELIGLERLKGRSSHNGEFSVMSRDSSKGNWFCQNTPIPLNVCQWTKMWFAYVILYCGYDLPSRG